MDALSACHAPSRAPQTLVGRAFARRTEIRTNRFTKRAGPRERALEPAMRGKPLQDGRLYGGRPAWVGAQFQAVSSIPTKRRL